MKRRTRECEDAWEGFDGRQYEYNEVEERKYESSVWKYLAVGSILLFLIVIFMHTKELYIILQGECIEAVYYIGSDGSEIAKYESPEGKVYRYNISQMNSVHTKDKIMMYYIDNVQEAIPKTKWTLWCMYYMFFGCLGGLSIWRIRKIYKK